MARLENLGACGWIIDLRGNTGGNVWPMLDAIGPLVDSRTPLTFDVPGQGRFQVLYEKGVAYQAGGAPPYVQARPEPLRRLQAPVALLTDEMTASSGEALVVAFKGRSRLRTFGQQTAGYVTVNNTADLPDGSLLLVTVGWNLDRNGRRYEGALQPDQALPPGTDAQPAAVEWLQRQPGCS
jgi:C-terminal processing protease CtpA/Prc